MPGTRLDIATKLAVDRTRVAYDRTMMAWIRTGTSLISFGFAIYKFFQFDVEFAKRSGRLVGPREFALLMVGLGLFSLVLGTAEHVRNMSSLKAEFSATPRSWTTIVAVLSSVLGALALLAVFFRE